MDLEAFTRTYPVPARDPGQTRPAVAALSTRRLLAARVRRGRSRRLAYLDSTFPWRYSGFRYHEALAIHELLPDAMFFSLWDMTDPFPARVEPLADFPRRAAEAGISDVYGVFQLFLAGLCGLGEPPDGGAPHVMEGPDLWRTFRAAGIRVHGAIHPGGGYTDDAAGLEAARRLSARLATTFSHVPEVVAAVPGVVDDPGAFVDTAFYAPDDERWRHASPLECVFAADGGPRKGAAVAVEAFAGLDPARFRLHVAGPHEHLRDAHPAAPVTYHGWCSPEQLRELHRRAHAFVSPVSADPGVVDGFPTQAARDAMSSGCLLVSANPGADHRMLRPGEHYVDCPADARTLRDAIVAVAADVEGVRRVAAAGAERVRERFDVRRGMAGKLRRMGLL